MLKQLLMRSLLIPFFACLGTSALAQSFEDVAQLEVIPGWRNAAGEHVAGLRISLAPGWKTYWRAPGAGGIPPLFSFEGSSNITASTPHWPTPEVFDLNGLRSIGYENSVVLPMTLIPENDADDIYIQGQVQIGVCETVCIPVSLEFDAVLPNSSSPDPAIAAAFLNQPMTASQANVQDIACNIRPIDDGVTLTTTLQMESMGAPEVVVVEAADPTVWVSEADVIRQGDQLQATVDMLNFNGGTIAVDRSEIRITVLGSNQAVDIQGC